jgi:hypothetical protein
MRIVSPVIRRASSKEGDHTANVVRLKEALRRPNAQLQHCQTRRSALLRQIRRRLQDPVVHSAAKMLLEYQGHAGVLSEPAVSETNPASLHELRWGSDVRICHARTP